MYRQRVYTFKGKREEGSAWVKYNVLGCSLDDAKRLGRKKWGKDILISTGKLNRSLSKLIWKTRWVRT